MALFHACDEECHLYREKDYPVPGRWVIGEYSFDRCPKSQIPHETYWWIKAYEFYKNGILPSSGGWLDQSFKFNETMLFISGKIEEHRRENANGN